MPDPVNIQGGPRVPGDEAAPRAGGGLRRVLLGAALGSLALWLSLRGLQPSALVAELARVHPGWMLASAGVNLAAVLATSLRWQLLFFPDHRALGAARLFRAVLIGQMLNIVVPLRLGELARMYIVAGQERLGKARVLATLAIEKALDLGMFALGVLMILPFVFAPDVAVDRRTVILVGVAGLAALWLLSRRGDRVLAVASRFTLRLPDRLSRRAAGAAEGFLHGLSALRDTRASLLAVAASAAVFGLAALGNYLLFLAFDLELPFLAAVFLLVLLQVGSVPPSLPGKIGIFHYLTMVGLAAFGVDRTTGMSYAIVLYAVALLPKVILGALYAASGGWTWRGVEQRA